MDRDELPQADGPPGPHRWEFKARLRRGAFGWKSSRLAIQRVKEAASEIRNVARRDPMLAAEGAVTFLERVSPALERVDSSSGALGTAVNWAIDELVPLIAAAPADRPVREGWLERLFEAHGADEIPYIELLADRWGELCASRELASAWADRLLDVTRMALGPDPRFQGYFHGTSACLSALYASERYGEIVDLLEGDAIWPYKRWAVLALAASGRKADATRYAQSCRGPWTPDGAVDALCEEILLSSGLVDEAYERYGPTASRRGTYLATFRAVAAKYPHRAAAEILADLASTTPGQEGKWFAAAKDAGLFEEALALAGRSPCDPKTLTRAARDFAEREPSFAVRAGLLALRWLAEGYGYEVTAADVLAAYTNTMKAAERNGTIGETRAEIRELVAGDTAGGFVATVLGQEVE